MVKILLCGHQCGFGHLLETAHHFYLLAVLVILVDAVVAVRELLNLAVQLSFLLGGNLVGALGQYGNGLVDVARHLAELGRIAGNRRVGHLLFLLFHSDILLIHVLLSNFFALVGAGLRHCREGL